MRGCRFDPVAIVMDEKALIRYLATGDYAPSADAAPMSLAAHDRLYHHGLFTGGRCLYRASQSADDPADALLVNAGTPHSHASPHGGSAPTPNRGGSLAAEIDAVKSLYTKPDGTHSKSWLRAPNGKPSNLSPDQWCLVRTPTFKNWFGDWEKQAEVDSAIDFLRSSPPVASLLGDEFPPGGEKLTERVPAYWKKHNDGIAVSPDFGEVKLDKEGVKSDIGHGISRLKAIAFAAVPAVIEKGIAYNRAKNWKGREWDSAVIGAPIKIGTDDYYCEVVIQRRPNRQGFYLHDVELKAKSEAAFKTPTQGSAAPLSKLIVAKLLAEVNPATVSKIVDSNGEPRLMFHGTSSRFSKFDPKYIRSTNWGKGFYFTSSEDDARHYGPIVMPCFLKSDNPLDLTTSANDAEYNKWYGKKNSPYDGFYTDISGKLMCVVPRSSQIFVAPDSLKKSDGLNLRAIADAVLAEDAAIDPEFEEKHPRGNSGNKGQFRKSEKTIAKLDEADAAVSSAPTPQGGGKVSPAEDAAYLAAVKNGDIATAKRMIREVAGRVIPTLLKDEDGLPLEMYHGSDQKRNVFKSFPNAYGLSGVNFIDTYGRALDYAMDKWATPENVERFAQEYPEQYEELAVEIGAESHADFADRMRDLDEDTREGIMGEVVTSAFLDIPDFTDVESIGGARVAVAQPNQIYSSEVTYDDDGNPIPLSKRFNRESNDIRY